MTQFADKQNIGFQVLISLLLAIYTGYILLDPNLNLFALIGVAGIVVLVIISILKVRIFIIVLLAIKPFIDLSWNVKLFSFAGTTVNPLEITGFLVFMVAGYLYFFQYEKNKIFNEGIIWTFLGLHLFISTVAFFSYARPAMSIAAALLKLFDAYFIYFIFHRFLNDERSKLQIIGIIWISTLLVGILSCIVYLTGHYDIDISQGVERFAGTYNDPGIPSYTAIMSLIFGTLYIEICKRQKRSVLPITRIIFILTIFITWFIMSITITKNAIVMLLVFLVMWIGLYKKKTYIILPLIIIGSYYIYTTSEKVHKRLAPEVEFLMEGEFSVETARYLGTGRAGLWQDILTHYKQNYSLFQQLFGSSRSFGAHNSYIVYLMRVGLIGLTVFFIILFRFYKRLYLLYKKYREPEYYMAVTVLTVWVANSFGMNTFDYTTLLWYLMILLSFINIGRNAINVSSEHVAV